MISLPRVVSALLDSEEQRIAHLGPGKYRFDRTQTYMDTLDQWRPYRWLILTAYAAAVVGASDFGRAIESGHLGLVAAIAMAAAGLCVVHLSPRRMALGLPPAGAVRTLIAPGLKTRSIGWDPLATLSAQVVLLAVIFLAIPSRMARIPPGPHDLYWGIAIGSVALLILGMGDAFRAYGTFVMCLFLPFVAVLLAYPGFDAKGISGGVMAGFFAFVIGAFVIILVHDRPPVPAVHVSQLVAMALVARWIGAGGSRPDIHTLGDLALVAVAWLVSLAALRATLTRLLLPKPIGLAVSVALVHLIGPILTGGLDPERLTGHLALASFEALLVCAVCWRYARASLTVDYPPGTYIQTTTFVPRLDRGQDYLMESDVTQ